MDRWTGKRAISRRELARRVGCSERVVRNRIADGSLSVALCDDGLLDAERGEKLLSRIISKGKAAPAALSSARTRKLRAQTATLQDEVEDMRASAITPEDATALMSEQCRVIADALTGLAWDAGTLAGKSAPDAANGLRDLVHAALSTVSAADVDLPEDDEDDDESPDLDEMSPVDLAARRLALQAEALELKRDLDRGDMLPVVDVVVSFEKALTTAKSLLLAIPSRCATYAESDTPAAFEARVQVEVDGALSELTVDLTAQKAA